MKKGEGEEIVLLKARETNNTLNIEDIWTKYWILESTVIWMDSTELYESQL